MSGLVVREITKAFPTRSDPLVVLRQASFDLAPGDNLAILGPSGSGKSTLLHILGTLEEPTSGSVTLGHQDPFVLGESELAKFRNQQIGFVFQDHHLLPQLSVLENVLLPTLAAGATTEQAGQRARELVEAVGLTSRIDHRPAELSGGERQRVAVARALVMQPQLILADEPTGNLDRNNAQAITELLLDLQASGSGSAAMLVVVTHSAEVAQQLHNRLYLRDGEMVDG